MPELPADCQARLAQLRTAGRLMILTGAGISAESGLPTFRGPEGYWTHGSEEYRPEEIATSGFFRRQPEIAWGWYLYRMDTYGDAAPNPGHHAITAIQEALGARCTLATQNVDGLHTKAGSPEDRTWEIHGAIRRQRCAAGCGYPPDPLPKGFGRPWSKELLPGAGEREVLTCKGCGSWLRPHVLWFDEFYDEENFRWDSCLRAAGACDLLLIAGTSGATNLPQHIASVAMQGGAQILAVNRDPSPFTAAAERQGWALMGSCGQWLPAIAAELTG